MFESITEAAAHWPTQRRAFLAIPPAFSAAALVLFALAGILDFRGLALTVMIGWVLGLFSITVALSVRCASAGQMLWALLAWPYAIVIAMATSFVGIHLMAVH